MKKSNPFSFKYFIHDFIWITAFLPGFIFWRPKHLYENKNAKKKIWGGGLLISNHLGFLDPVFLMYGFWYRRLHFIALRILFNTKAKNFWFRKFLCIPIDRENLNMDTFREIVGEMKNDHLVAMFPEGHINFENDELQKFKSGMILMAMQSKKPIYPVYIKKEKSFWKRLLIAVGEPITLPTGMGLKEIETATQDLYEKEILLKKIADNYYKK